MIILNDKQKKDLERLGFQKTNDYTFFKSYESYENEKYTECGLDLIVNPIGEEKDVIIVSNFSKYIDEDDIEKEFVDYEFSYNIKEIFQDMIELYRIGIIDMEFDLKNIDL